jgi:hypothetical protein
MEVDVNDLKPVRLPGAVDGWRVSEAVWEAIFRYDEDSDQGWGVDKTKLVVMDAGRGGLREALSKSWKGLHVWLQGLYWQRAEALAVQKKMDEDRPFTLTWALPDLHCEKWFRQLDSKEYPCVWERLYSDTGLEEEQDDRSMMTTVVKGIEAISEEERLVDGAGRPMGRLAFAAWLCRMEPKRRGRRRG